MASHEAALDLTMTCGVFLVTEHEWLARCRDLANFEGLHVGRSTGAGVDVALRIANTLDEPGNIVCIGYVAAWKYRIVRVTMEPHTTEAFLFTICADHESADAEGPCTFYFRVAEVPTSALGVYALSMDHAESGVVVGGATRVTLKYRALGLLNRQPRIVPSLVLRRLGLTEDYAAVVGKWRCSRRSSAASSGSASTKLVTRTSCKPRGMTISVALGWAAYASPLCLRAPSRPGIAPASMPSRTSWQSG